MVSSQCELIPQELISRCLADRMVRSLVRCQEELIHWISTYDTYDLVHRMLKFPASLWAVLDITNAVIGFKEEASSTRDNRVGSYCGGRGCVIRGFVNICNFKFSRLVCLAKELTLLCRPRRGLSIG